jgi:hypothetical protein
MRFDFQLLFILIIIGLMVKSLNIKVWLGVSLLIFIWMMFNWLHG